MLQQDELADLAGLERKRVKAMMGRSRKSAPEVPEVVKLAEAAKVPRVFAERGFEGLWEPDEQLLHDVARLKETVSQLAAEIDALRREVVLQRRGGGTSKQTGAVGRKTRQSRPPQQP